MKLDYLAILQDSICKGCLPPKMTQGLMVLIYKGKIRYDLSNLRPIILLNIGYMI